MYRFTDSQYTGSFRPSHYLSADPIRPDNYGEVKHDYDYASQDSIASSHQFSLSLSQRDDPQRVEILREEVNALRKKLESLSIQNSRELLALNEKQEERLKQIYQDKESHFHAEYQSISQVQRILGEEIDESSKIKQEILRLKLDHGENIAKLNAEIRGLVNELDYIRRECIEPTRSQIDLYRNEIDRKKEDQNRESRSFQHDKGVELHEIQYQVEKDSNILDSLKAEIEELQKQLTMKSIKSEDNLSKLSEKLKYAQNAATDQENELKQLRNRKERVRKEAREKAKEVSLIKYRFQTVESENKDLKEQLGRLERLIYGRTKEGIH